jgi:hypothetical protein
VQFKTRVNFPAQRTYRSPHKSHTEALSHGKCAQWQTNNWRVAFGWAGGVPPPPAPFPIPITDGRPWGRCPRASDVIGCSAQPVDRASRGWQRWCGRVANEDKVGVDACTALARQKAAYGRRSAGLLSLDYSLATEGQFRSEGDRG